MFKVIAVIYCKCNKNVLLQTDETTFIADEHTEAIICV